MNMQKRFLISAILMQSGPAFAEPLREPALVDRNHSIHLSTLSRSDDQSSTPRALRHFEIAERNVELIAVTRSNRARTNFSRFYIDDCENMAKVYPGYPQPALVSVDVRFQF